MNNSKKQMLKYAASHLLLANNTLTTLELKTELRENFSNKSWTQKEVSKELDNLIPELSLTYIDLGTFRVYSKMSISKTLKPN